MVGMMVAVDLLDMWPPFLTLSYRGGAPASWKKDPSDFTQQTQLD
jgi:hypothetical protein